MSEHQATNHQKSGRYRGAARRRTGAEGAGRYPGSDDSGTLGALTGWRTAVNARLNPRGRRLDQKKDATRGHRQ